VDLRESDVGTQADLFEVTKIGDEYFTWVTSSKTTAGNAIIGNFLYHFNSYGVASRSKQGHYQ